MAASNTENSTSSSSLQVVLALMVQWKCLVECVPLYNSRFDLLEKIAEIFIVTRVIANPGAVVSETVVEILSRVWEQLGGHSLNSQANAEMEQWFQVVTSFVAQYGLAALLQWSKYSVTCLQNNNCQGVLLPYFMDLRSFTCGFTKDLKLQLQCHYFFCHLPLALIILARNKISSIISSKHNIEEGSVELVSEVSKAPSNQMLNVFCPLCQNQTQIALPHAFRTFYCRNC